MKLFLGRQLLLGLTSGLRGGEPAGPHGLRAALPLVDGGAPSPPGTRETVRWQRAGDKPDSTGEGQRRDACVWPGAGPVGEEAGGSL